MLPSSDHQEQPSSADEKLRAALEKVPPAPAVITKILKLAKSDDFAPQQIAEIIRSDAVLVARVMETSRKTFFARTSVPGTLTEAIARLGSSMIYKVSLNSCVADMCENPTHLYRAPTKTFWERAVNTAIAMEQGAEQSQGEHPYTAGLMHLVGVWLLCQILPQSEDKIEARSLAEQEAVEAERFGTTYARIGAQALRAWGFNEAVASAVEFQNSPETAGEHRVLAEHLKDAIWVAECALCLCPLESQREAMRDAEFAARVERVRKIAAGLEA
jgi:HD-like signal output (HDOD) protein